MIKQSSLTELWKPTNWVIYLGRFNHMQFWLLKTKCYGPTIIVIPTKFGSKPNYEEGNFANNNSFPLFTGRIPTGNL